MPTHKKRNHKNTNIAELRELSRCERKSSSDRKRFLIVGPSSSRKLILKRKN